MKQKREGKMQGHEFKRWRKHTMKLTAEQTAAVIGVSLRAVQAWEQADNPIPQYAINCLRYHAIIIANGK